MIKSHRFELTDGATVAAKMKEMKLNAVTNTSQACDLGKALGIGKVTMSRPMEMALTQKNAG